MSIIRGIPGFRQAEQPCNRPYKCKLTRLQVWVSDTGVYQTETRYRYNT